MSPAQRSAMDPCVLFLYNLLIYRTSYDIFYFRGVHATPSYNSLRDWVSKFHFDREYGAVSVQNEK